MSDIRDIGEALVGPSQAELNRRKNLQANYYAAFSGEAGHVVLADIAEILHFIGPAYTPEDMALQNAFKTILHRLGAWADDEQGRLEIIRKLRQ